MNKIQISIAAVIAAISCIASASPTVVGDNSDEVKKHADLKPKATAYISKLDKEVSKIIGIGMSRRQLTSQEIAAQNRAMNALAEEGEPLGNFLESPLHRCRFAGSSARMLWQTMTGFITVQTPQRAYDDYQKVAKECRQQIATAPAPTVTVHAPLKQATPPYRGCLAVMLLDPPPGSKAAKPNYTEWTCPKGSVR